MPYSDDPHCLVLDSIEEPVWIHDHFAKGEVWKFGEKSSGIGKFLEARELLFCSMAKGCSCRGIVSVNVGNRIEELATARRGE